MKTANLSLIAVAGEMKINFFLIFIFILRTVFFEIILNMFKNF